MNESDRTMLTKLARGIGVPIDNRKNGMSFMFKGKRGSDIAALRYTIAMVYVLLMTILVSVTTYYMIMPASLGTFAVRHVITNHMSEIKYAMSVLQTKIPGSTRVLKMIIKGLPRLFEVFFVSANLALVSSVCGALMNRLGHASLYESMSFLSSTLVTNMYSAADSTIVRNTADAIWGGSETTVTAIEPNQFKSYDGFLSDLLKSITNSQPVRIDMMSNPFKSEDNHVEKGAYVAGVMQMGNNLETHFSVTRGGDNSSKVLVGHGSTSCIELTAQYTGKLGRISEKTADYILATYNKLYEEMFKHVLSKECHERNMRVLNMLVECAVKDGTDKYFVVPMTHETIKQLQKFETDKPEKILEEKLDDTDNKIEQIKQLEHRENLSVTKVHKLQTEMKLKAKKIVELEAQLKDNGIDERYKELQRKLDHAQKDKSHFQSQLDAATKEMEEVVEQSESDLKAKEKELSKANTTIQTLTERLNSNDGNPLPTALSDSILQKLNEKEAEKEALEEELVAYRKIFYPFEKYETETSDNVLARLKSQFDHLQVDLAEVVTSMPLVDLFLYLAGVLELLQMETPTTLGKDMYEHIVKTYKYCVKELGIEPTQEYQKWFEEKTKHLEEFISEEPESDEFEYEVTLSEEVLLQAIDILDAIE